MKWIDISQPLTNSVAHWPGDVPFVYELTYIKQQTGSVNIGRMTTSLHTGTHIDAPFHFDDQGKTILELELDPFIGPARVIDVSSFEMIGRKELEALQLDGESRLLLKTSVPNQPNIFPRKVIPIHPNLGPFLKEKQIVLLGVDVPSIDPLDSKEMAAHHSLHQNGIHILENALLDHVSPGNYELIALPLPLEGADGSPVRAVLRPIETTNKEESL
ncbi:arylformamidase [Bacillus ectoiniformans]|uniref:arylformamidase n=1 Tax=Bacillus ectoiniformans TaxID=1494429 RepID=UPI00195E8C10|nr:arylformamidase [Bacillus ectoiniformans]MBM7648265.1 arylformamidase [Bacillus ectoiniformans]